MAETKFLKEWGKSQRDKGSFPVICKKCNKQCNIIKITGEWACENCGQTYYWSKFHLLEPTNPLPTEDE